MAESTVTIAHNRKPELVALLHRLPAMLAGRVPDEHGIVEGFKARLGFQALSLIKENFELLGRGQAGADGTKWHPLSPAYLAYGRRFGKGEQGALRKAAGAKGKHAPGDKKGLLTRDQLQLWRNTYARYLKYYMTREPIAQAKGHAAAVAWIIVKEAGGKTKLDVYGKRVVQMLVDTGRLRDSLTPGVLTTPFDIDPDYSKPGGLGGQEQVYENNPGEVVIGTNVKYAKHHHSPKSPNRKRRLWPLVFPKDWWELIVGQAASGLARIGQLFNGTGGL